MSLSEKISGASECVLIAMLANRLAQAADDRNLDSYRECLAPRINGVERHIYATAAIQRVSAMSWTHHKLFNHVVTISGKRAVAVVDVVVDMAVGDMDATRTATIGGRYELGLTNIGGQWAISSRTMHRRYLLGNIDLATGSADEPDNN